MQNLDILSTILVILSQFIIAHYSITMCNSLCAFLKLPRIMIRICILLFDTMISLDPPANIIRFRIIKKEVKYIKQPLARICIRNVIKRLNQQHVLIDKMFNILVLHLNLFSTYTNLKKYRTTFWSDLQSITSDRIPSCRWLFGLNFNTLLYNFEMHGSL